MTNRHYTNITSQDRDEVKEGRKPDGLDCPRETVNISLPHSGNGGNGRQPDKHSCLREDGFMFSPNPILRVLDGMRLALTGESSGRKTERTFRVDHATSLLLEKCADQLGILKVEPMERRVKQTMRFKLNGGNPTPREYEWQWSIEQPSFDLAVPAALSELEVLVDFYPKILTFPFDVTLDFFKKISKFPREKFIKYFKYHTVWPMAKYLGSGEDFSNPLPQRPDGFVLHPLIWGGPIKRLLKTRLVASDRKTTRLFASILQGVKRGCAQADPEMIISSFEKHREALSQDGTVQDSELQELVPYAKRFWESYQQGKIRKVFEASSSASTQLGIGGGGARNWLFYHFNDQMTPSWQGKKTKYEGWYDIIRLLEHENIPSLCLMIETKPGVVVEMRGFLPPSYTNVLRDIVQRGVDSEGKVHTFFGKDVTSDVVVAPVLEPLKVRLVSKGDALKYYFSRSVQKDMWKYLQTFPQFCLTGRPLSEIDLNWLDDPNQYNRHIRGDNTFWVSGDYEGATDSIKLDFTKLFFESYLERTDLSPIEIDTLRGVIYEQMIVYPPVENSKGEQIIVPPVLQRTGQLMGSTLSFPLLCAINFCCFWKTYEEYVSSIMGMKVSIPIETVPVLVNGDDILFKSNKTFYEKWRENIAKVGFKLSLGKNYCHPKILTVNSQFYEYSDSGAPKFKKLEFLNVGLLLGQSKLVGRESTRMAPLGAVYNEVMKGGNDPLRLHRRFIHYHLEEVKKLTSDGKYNLHCHPLFGGLGCDVFPGMEPRFTTFQRSLGSYRYKKFQLDSTEFQKVLIGRKIQGKSKSEVPPVPIVRERSYKFVNTIGPLNEGLTRKITDLTVYPPSLQYVANPSYKDKFDLEVEKPFFPKKKELEEMDKDAFSFVHQEVLTNPGISQVEYDASYRTRTHQAVIYNQMCLLRFLPRYF